jgi:hypothetical protein
LTILQDGQHKGTNILEIAKKMTNLPAGVRVLSVFDTCKEQGWIGGSAWAPWLTREGKAFST